ncbi:hypothetical protein C8F04DRAFT_1129569 [Mycena alexandri]|uniref:Uncharacterized protein n=1 Tax=Mycena alexandri TaxID=1745969 RepID=A0AAD6SCU3_9AGAR|nr:hypothetical protein C8F04DRAFT_1129569 [Mycena alexandri]
MRIQSSGGSSGRGRPGCGEWDREGCVERNHKSSRAQKACVPKTCQGRRSSAIYNRNRKTYISARGILRVRSPSRTAIRRRPSRSETGTKRVRGLASSGSEARARLRPRHTCIESIQPRPAHPHTSRQLARHPPTLGSAAESHHNDLRPDASPSKPRTHRRLDLSLDPTRSCCADASRPPTLNSRVSSLDPDIKSDASRRPSARPPLCVSKKKI